MKNRMIVVADLGSLKAYKIDKIEHTGAHKLELVHDVQLEHAHEKITDMVSDQGGRFANRGTAAGASAGERHNIEIEHRKRLVRQITDRIEKLLAIPEVHGCYFAASKEINHQVIDGLDTRTRAKIEKNLPVDLTKIDKEVLLGRFLAAD